MSRYDHYVASLDTKRLEVLHRVENRLRAYVNDRYEKKTKADDPTYLDPRRKGVAAGCGSQDGGPVSGPLRRSDEAEMGAAGINCAADGAVCTKHLGRTVFGTVLRLETADSASLAAKDKGSLQAVSCLGAIAVA